MTNNKKGYPLILDPILNKSTAFKESEKQSLGLLGLLPDTIETLDLQHKRCLLQFNAKNTPLEKYIYLISLLEHNETLFYSLIMSDPVKFLPILYTPTVGDACLEFSHIFNRPHGLYISLKRQGQVKTLLQNWPHKNIGIICVTNGSRILGLGDIGANGMGIPIGKLQLYTACAGVHPQKLLPVMIDVGTNNEQLLSDPLYLGLKQKRCSTQDLYAFVDEFVDAVQEVFPGCCIQFEDWAGPDAVALLARYRHKISMFNDDIQGTAAVMITAMTNACRIKNTNLKDESFLFLGAGSAAVGLSDMLCSAMVKEGLSLDQAQKRIRLFDINGLLTKKRSDLYDYQLPYAHDDEPIDKNNFLTAINKFKPTALIGVSTASGAFTPEIISAMAEINKRPIIFAMSNPTSKAECTAESAYRYTNGKVIFGAGVQFPNVTLNGKTYTPSQANNFYIFPAVGMAICATKARLVTDEMFIECAKAVANLVPPTSLEQGLLFPKQAEMLDTGFKAAVVVSEYIFKQKLANVPEPNDIEKWLREQIYTPLY